MKYKITAWAHLLAGFILIALIALLTTAAIGHAAQQPYGGAPWSVPGSIEAEDYDTGGEGIAYHDRTAGNSGAQYRTDDVDIWYASAEGYYTGANATGDWLEYTVDVAASGEYQLDFRLATPNSGRQLRVTLDGADVTGLITVPNTGSWVDWQTVSTTANLTAGQHVLRITFVVGGLNFSWFDLVQTGGGGPPTAATPPTITPAGGTFSNSVTVSLQTSTPGAAIYYTTNGTPPSTASTAYTGSFSLTANATVRAYAVASGYDDSAVASADFTVTTGSSGQQPYGGTPWSVPGSIEAEDYDTGGEGIAYHDRTAGNSGAQYRTDDVDIWYSSAEGYYTGANATGEWLEYTVDVAASGEYQLDFRLATPNSGRQLRVTLDGADVTGLITVPNTGSWVDWQTVSTTANLTAGQHVLRITFVVGGLNFSWFDLVQTGGGGPPTAATPPTITPDGGTFSNSVTVSLQTSTPGAAIYYTTNGTPPSTASTAYTGSFSLTANATVRAFAVASGYDDSAVASADFTVTTGSSGQQPYGGTPWTVPGSIEAEDYDTGGEGIAYHDRTAGNSGASIPHGRRGYLVFEQCSEGYYTGANGTGEWLEYTVDVAASGQYQLDFRLATPNSGRQLRVNLDGADVTGLITVPNTGSWVDWQTVSTTANLTAGQHVLRIMFVVGGLNFSWIDLVQTGGGGTPTAATPTITPNGGSVQRFRNGEPADVDAGRHDLLYDQRDAAEHRFDGIHGIVHPDRECDGQGVCRGHGLR